MGHDFHIFLHISLFGLWIGSVVALLVLILRLFSNDGAEGPRAVGLQHLAYIQRVPKSVLVLMLPMGLQLSSNLGLITLGNGSTVGVWAFALIWLAIDWMAAPSGVSSTSHAMRVVERVFQAAFVLVLLGAGILSHLSGDPVNAPWLATKMILFAFALVLMAGVDALLVPLYRASEQELSERKTPLLGAALLLAVLVALLLTAAWTGFTNWRP